MVLIGGKNSDNKVLDARVTDDGILMVSAEGSSAFIDGVNGSDATGTGTPASPFASLASAYASNASILMLAPGIYREYLTVSRPLTLLNGQEYAHNAARSPATVDLRGTVRPTTWFQYVDGSGNATNAYWTTTSIAYNVWLVPRDTIDITAVDSTGGVLTITTANTHGFKAGEQVCISGMNPTTMNGTYTIVTADDPNRMTFTVAGTGTVVSVASAKAASWEDNSARWAALHHVGDLDACVKTPGTWSHFRGDRVPVSGAYQARITTATRSTKTITCTTDVAHGLKVGDIVQVSGTSVAGYNGLWHVASVADSTHFTYLIGTASGASATGGAVYLRHALLIHLADTSNPTGQWVEVASGGTGLSAQRYQALTTEDGSQGCTFLRCDGISFTGWTTAGLRAYQGDSGATMYKNPLAAIEMTNCRFRYCDNQYENFTAPAWVKNTAYAAGQWVMPTTPNGFYYKCKTAGTSHASTEPTWSVTTLTAGSANETSDNGIVWETYPAIADKWAANTAHRMSDSIIPTALAEHTYQWDNGKTVAEGDYAMPTTGFSGLIFQAQGAGTTDATEPVWPSIVNDTVTDNDVVWKAVGLYTHQATTPGTTHATTEPIWATTGGATTTDNEVTWTARLYDGPDGNGFSSKGHFTTTLRGCEAVGNGVDGFNYHEGGSHLAANCCAHHNRDNGISPHEFGELTIDGGAYYSNGDQQIGYASGATGAVRRCRVDDSDTAGIYAVNPNTRVLVEDVLITNCLRGLQITEGAEVLARNIGYGELVTISTATRNGAGVATITTAEPHNLLVGESVTIAGCSVAAYNATFTVVTAADAYTFTVALAGTGNGTGGTATYHANTTDVVIDKANSSRLWAQDSHLVTV